MRNLLLTCAATAAAAVSFVAAAPAEARQGCGNGWHRAYNGRCVPNRGYERPGVRLVIGNYYNGRGYWDGRRYYAHRARHHRGWRYW